MTGASEHSVDVAIIGGGPAGATTALCLARAGLRPLIIERAAESGDPVGESLAPSVTALLRRLNLLDSLLETEPLPCYGNRSSWGGDGRLTDYDFIRDPSGHGWHIDRGRFDRALLNAARGAGARCLTGFAFRSIERTEDGCWRLGLAAGDRELAVSARFAVDASGRGAVLARRLAVHRTHLDRLLAVTAFLESEASPCQDSTTLIEATAEGWWYSAVIPDGRLVVTFMTDPDLLAAGRVWQPEVWLDWIALAPGTLERVVDNRFRLTTRPRVAAAGTSRLEEVAGPGWLAAGDAAAAFDPLSSHGVGTAIAGGSRAAKAVLACLGGDREAATEYAARVNAAFDRFLPLWCAYYAQELRWPEALFWRRRHARCRG